MAVGCVRGTIRDLTGMGDGALDGVKVFANFAADGNTQGSVFECGAEAREELGFESGCELTEFHLAVGSDSPHPGPLPNRGEGTAAELAGDVVAEAVTGAGVVVADFGGGCGAGRGLRRGGGGTQASFLGPAAGVSRDGRGRRASQSAT